MKANASHRELPRPVRTVLRVPLFYKILIANAAIVLLGAVAGTAATAEFGRLEPGQSPVALAVVLAVAGVSLTVLVNAAILRVALSPLKLLEDTAAQVQKGDMAARAPFSRLADPELDRLTRTFNGMLDTQADYRQRLREMAARALEAEEEERKRIARELHDETAQSLAALLIRLRLARGVSDQEERDELLDDMRRDIGSTLEGVRRFARGLRPPALDELGLSAAVESHARGLRDSVGLAVTVSADTIEGQLSAQAELALYRIVQEALSNVVRHSGASEARVTLSHTGQSVIATISDQGSGFAPGAGYAGRGDSGLGIFGMKERAAYAGGEFALESTPGSGTTVQATIPVAPNPPPAATATAGTRREVTAQG